MEERELVVKVTVAVGVGEEEGMEGTSRCCRGGVRRCRFDRCLLRGPSCERM